MESPSELALALLAGMGLGLFYFGSQWLSYRLMSGPRRESFPVVLALFIARVGVTLIGLYLVTAGSWQRLVACLSGFVLIWVLPVFLWRSPRAAS